MFSTSDLDHWQKLRLKRIERVREYIKLAKRIEKQRLLGILGRNGIRRETAESYLQDLIDAGDIKIENNWIIWIGDQ